LKIFHFSDPHAGSWLEDWCGLFDKRLLGVLNFNLRRKHLHVMARLEKFVEIALNEKPDLVICTGDLTSVGQPGEFKESLEVLSALRDSDIPLVCIPGNHDSYVNNSKCRSALVDAMSYLNRDLNFSLDDLPSSNTVGDVDLIIVNECYATNPASSCGYIKKDTNSFVVDACAGKKERPRIFIGHYPLIEPFSLSRMRRRLWGQGNIVTLLHDKSIDLSLCGHIHQFYDILDEDGRGETCAGSITKHGTFTQITYHKNANKFIHVRRTV